MVGFVKKGKTNVFEQSETLGSETYNEFFFVCQILIIGNGEAEAN